MFLHVLLQMLSTGPIPHLVNHTLLKMIVGCLLQQEVGQFRDWAAHKNVVF